MKDVVVVFYETDGIKMAYNAKEKLETYTIKQRVT